MKINDLKIFLNIGLIILISFISSCKKKDLQEESRLILETEEIHIHAQGGDTAVNYKISNSIQREIIHIENSPEWVRPITAEKGKIKMTIAPNRMKETRKGNIVLKYLDQSQMIKVNQLGQYESDKNLSFSVNIKEITDHSITFEVIPNYNDLTYIISSIDKKSYDNVKSDQELIDIILNQLKDAAKQSNLPYEKFLEQSLKKGQQKNVLIDNIPPDTENYIILLGINEKGEPTSSLHTEMFKTKEKDFTFNMIADIKDHNAIITIIPSNNEIPYFYEMIDAVMFDNDFGGDADALAKDLMKSTVDLGTMFGMELSDIIDKMCLRGTVEKDLTGMLNAETEYVSMAAAVDETTGDIISKTSVLRFKTGSVPKSENIISLEVSEIKTDRVTVNATTTNKDPYVILAIEKDKIKNMTDDELSTMIKEKYNLNSKIINDSKQFVYTGLLPETDYYLLAFGYVAGVPNTAIFKTDFSTTSLGDPTKFCYTTTISNVKVKSVHIETFPTPDNVMYYFDICKQGISAEEIKDELNKKIQENIKNGYIANQLEFFQTRHHIGNNIFDYKFLQPQTEYQIYAFSINDKDGSFATDVQIGDSFMTKKVSVLEDISIEIEHDKYFDVDMMNEEYGGLQGIIGQGLYCQPLKIICTGDYQTTYVSYFEGTLADYSDNDLIYNLVDLGKGDKRSQFDIFLPYNTDISIIAVAENADGNFSRCFKVTINKSKDGISPVSEYIGIGDRSFNHLLRNSIFEKVIVKPH